MANTTVKPARAPRTPRAPKAQPEVVETKPETVEIEPEDVTTPVSPETEAPEVAPEPEVTAPEQPEASAPEPEPEPEPEQPVAPGNRTTVYLVQKGEKFNVYRDVKKLTRNLVSLEKARLIARAYGESNPTIQ